MTEPVKPDWEISIEKKNRNRQQRKILSTPDSTVVAVRLMQKVYFKEACVSFSSQTNYISVNTKQEVVWHYISVASAV